MRSRWPSTRRTRRPSSTPVKRIAPTFGGINLEDISAPRCFEIEDALRAALDIPVFHDDQHGTAIVALAPLINALRIVKKTPDELKVVVNGVGASGTAVSRIFMDYGVTNIIGCDRTGAIYRDRGENMNFMKEWYSQNTNPAQEKGTLADVIEGADVFVGLSAPGTLTVADAQEDESRPGGVRHGQPDPGNHAGGGGPVCSHHGDWVAQTIRIRSTTSWRFPVSFAARSTVAPPRSTTR